MLPFTVNLRSLFCCLVVVSLTRLSAAPAPFRLAVVGLDHGHVDTFLADALARKDVQVVGVVESKPALAADYARRLKLAPDIQFSNLEQMLTSAKPDAVAIFTSTFAHAEVVEACAAHGVPVMMEKPLAVSMEHAHRIERAARDHHIRVIVNYETTWFPSNKAAYDLTRDQSIGPIRKVVVRSGHQGPKEIGCPPAFLTWLTDPKLNGGGALTDFGCYGADLITWLMDGQRPTRVTAVTQQLKPDVYPQVDDDATIILTYPRAQGIIQASWNWPIGRKDMDIFGVSGQIQVADRSRLLLRKSGGQAQTIEPPALEANYREPLGYLIAVVRGEITEHPLSTLATNLIVTEILDAARESAATHRSIELVP
ncbi:MAG: Gfo/Idh/MocA family oxidoreductase [Opitutus sp.]